MNVPPEYHSPLLQSAIHCLSEAGIELQVSKKRVKNINFRLKPHILMVSVPTFISPAQVAESITKRVPWAIQNHAQVLEQYKRKKSTSSEYSVADSPVLLWGIAQSFSLSHDKKIAYYRQALSKVTPVLFDKWQPIVGANANEIRLKRCIRDGAVVIPARAVFGCLFICLLILLNVPNTSSSMSCVICIMPITVLHFGKRLRQRCLTISNGIICWQVKRVS